MTDKEYAQHVEDCRSFRNLKSFSDAEAMASQRSKETGETWLAVDSGPYCYPRFEIVKLPKIGDPVSKAFNGDSYPVGQVVSISKTYKLITTSTGVKFYRHKLTRSWLQNNTWHLVPGHISTWNPSF